MKNNRKGFTLLELLLVIMILGLLSVLISGNYLTSIKKGRDARRKTELEQIQRGLEMYYEDNKAYPSSITFGSQLCHPSGCSTKVYMQKIPTDPKTDCSYRYTFDSATSSYVLYATIENTLDNGPGVNQAGYGVNCSSVACPCRYGITSPNTSL